ncbi:phosphate uptake regulator PhoU [Haladaptatus halobius]|uniref:phosphate uptake regulator PhoU n=1 Tax=Haladaptatus halobius TaxID=2884875 RepID=UPI001D0B5035|nr:phosphate uptake regulator PhoU [Haladaptatus halobius]
MKSRKIQKIGSGTFTVSLPPEWAKSENLSQGSIVDLHTHIDGGLVIQPRANENDLTEQVTIEVAHNDGKYITHLMQAAYTAGFDKVTLVAQESFTNAHRQAVNEAVSILSGVTISTESQTRITVQILLDPKEISVRQLVRQLKVVALSMHRNATATLSNEKTAASLADRDDYADRLYTLIDRSFERALLRLDEIDALGLTRTELFELWVTARELERIADHAEHISEITAEFDNLAKVTYTSEFQQIAQMARDIVEDAVSSILGDTDVNTAYRALTVRDQVREEAAALDRRLFEASSADYRLALVLNSLRRTAEQGGNIAERELQAVIRRGDIAVQQTDDNQEDEH